MKPATGVFLRDPIDEQFAADARHLFFGNGAFDIVNLDDFDFMDGIDAKINDIFLDTRAGRIKDAGFLFYLNAPNHMIRAGDNSCRGW